MSGLFSNPFDVLIILGVFMLGVHVGQLIWQKK